MFRTSTMMLVFLPGAWITYGIFRFILSYIASVLSIADQAELSTLAGIVYLACMFVIGWEYRNDPAKHWSGKNKK